MKTTRRTFIGTLSVAILTAREAFAARSFFQKKALTPRSFSDPYVGPPKQGEPHKSVAYVYNAGMDFDVRDHTFGQIPMIPGGKVTRIEQCEEWSARGIDEWNERPGRPLYTQPGRFGRIFGMKPRLTGWQPSEGEQKQAAGLYRLERVIVGRERMTDRWLEKKHLDRMIPDPRENEPIYEDRYVIVHSALEIALNLQEWSRWQIVVLHFWNDKEVDVDWVNGLIAADTLQQRIEKASALRTQRESSLLTLRAALLPVLALYAKKLRNQLAQNIVATWQESPFERNARTLLGCDTSVSKRPTGKSVDYQANFEEAERQIKAMTTWIEKGIPLWGA